MQVSNLIETIYLLNLYYDCRLSKVVEIQQHPFFFSLGSDFEPLALVGVLRLTVPSRCLFDGVTQLPASSYKYNFSASYW